MAPHWLKSGAQLSSGDLPSRMASEHGQTPGDNRERNAAILHDLLRKEGRNPGELAHAFIYVGNFINFIKREGASSTKVRSAQVGGAREATRV